MLRVWNISCFIMLYVSHYYRDVFSAHDVLKGGRHGKTKTLPSVDEIETRINLPTVKALACSCIKCGSWRKKKNCEFDSDESRRRAFTATVNGTPRGTSSKQRPAFNSAKSSRR